MDEIMIQIMDILREDYIYTRYKIQEALFNVGLHVN